MGKFYKSIKFNWLEWPTVNITIILTMAMTVDGHDNVMTTTYKSMKLSWVEWLGAGQQPESSKLAHDVLP